MLSRMRRVLLKVMAQVSTLEMKILRSMVVLVIIDATHVTTPYVGFVYVLCTFELFSIFWRKFCGRLVDMLS